MKNISTRDCIYCGEKTKTLETRMSLGGTRRRRKCTDCKARYTTIEIPIISEYYKKILNSLIKDIYKNI